MDKINSFSDIFQRKIVTYFLLLSTYHFHCLKSHKTSSSMHSRH